MYGYQLLLNHPDRRSQSVLRLVSRRRYSSVVALLQGEGLWAQYRDWAILRFDSAWAPHPGATPRVLEQEIAPPGSLLSIAA